MDNKKGKRQKNKGHKSKDKQGSSLSDLEMEVKDNYFQNGLYVELLRPDPDNFDRLFNEIERFAREVGSALSTHQLRNIYGEIQKAKSVQDLKMLRPKLAYMAARQEKNIKGKKIIAFVEGLIKDVKEENLESFKTIMESLVAYHKYYANNK